MQVKSDAEVASAPVEMEGAKDVTMQILVGPEDGSCGIIMRLFTVAPGGCTPYHTQGFEHLVRVHSG